MRYCEAILRKSTALNAAIANVAQVATFRSANYVTECLKDALVSPERRKGPCNERRTAAANYCWQMKVLQALIPSFQPKVRRRWGHPKP